MQLKTGKAFGSSNMYSITETTIHVTYKEMDLEDINSNISNIGVALSHLKIHILDEKLKPVSNNKVGKMYIEGHGLARGYIN